MSDTNMNRESLIKVLASYYSALSPNPIRLAAQMKQTNYQQTLLKLEKDEETLLNWAQQFYLFASQQAG